MELTESIETINERLLRDFGCFADKATWRVVLAGIQFEKRLIQYTDEGFELVNPEVREVPKYQHIEGFKYVLERHVPVQGETDLVSKTSYEPAWVFEDRYGNYLPPKYEAIEFLIKEIIYANAEKGIQVKKDPDADPDSHAKKVKRMEELLFGNETPVSDALRYGYGVAGFHDKTGKVAIH